QAQQVLQRCFVVCQVGNDAQHAAIGTQLLVAAYAVSVQRNQANAVGAVLLCAQRCQLGGGGGLTDTGGAHQCKYAALIPDRCLGTVSAQVVRQDLHHPLHGFSSTLVLGQTFQHGARQGGGVARTNHLEHQIGVQRI